VGVHLVSGGGRYLGSFDTRQGSIQRRIAGLCDRCVQRVVACNRPETWPTEVESFRIL
jgi:hypothetical protein